MENLLADSSVFSELKSLVVDNLQQAKRLGATAAEICLDLTKGFSVNIRRGEIDTLEYHRNKGLSVTVYLNHKKASVSTTDLSKAGVDLAIDKAYKIAGLCDEDKDAGLAGPEFLAVDYPDLDLYHPWSVDERKAISLARECETLAFKSDKRITNSDGASVSSTQTLHVYGNSTGFIGAYPLTHHSLSCILIAGEGDGMQRDYEYTIACDPGELLSGDEIAKRAVMRTVRRLGARTITTRAVPVIFARDIAKSLLGNFVSAVNGYSLYRKSSFLLDKLGQRIFPDYISIDERPHLPKALGSAPFDDEGVRTQPRTFVADGILQSYVLDSYTGRKLKMATTGNAGGVHNLFITSKKPSLDLDGLLREMGTGLFVTELMGQGPNLVTGDYSRAAFGFWVENGIIQYPVTGITIAANLKDMFLHLAALGNDIDHRSNIHTGSLLIANMIVTGSER